MHYDLDKPPHSLPINSKQISRKRPGLTLGFCFLAWPIRLPAAWSLPPLMSATILGLAATNSWPDGEQLALVDLGDAVGLRSLRRPSGRWRASRRTLRGRGSVSSSPALHRGRSARPGRAAGMRELARSSMRLLLERPQHVLLHPVAGQLAVADRRGQLDEIIDQRLALVHQHVAVVGRDAVGGFQALRAGRPAIRRATPDSLRPCFGRRSPAPGRARGSSDSRSILPCAAGRG